MTDHEYERARERRWKATEAKAKAVKEIVVATCWAVFLVALVAGLVRLWTLASSLGQ